MKHQRVEPLWACLFMFAVELNLIPYAITGLRRGSVISPVVKQIGWYNMYLAVDPGEKRTGWARFDEQGETTGFGYIDGIDEFLDWLEDQPTPKVLIMEEWRNNPGIPQAFSRVRTVECIGGVKRFCRKNGVKLVEQRNTVLPIGLRYIGMYQVYYKGTKKAKHVDDEISALAHGTYYLVKNKLKKHRLDTSNES